MFFFIVLAPNVFFSDGSIRFYHEMIRYNHHICNGHFTLFNCDDKFKPLFAMVTKQASYMQRSFLLYDCNIISTTCHLQ